MQSIAHEAKEARTVSDEKILEPASKKRGRPPAFPREHLDRLAAYYRQLGKDYSGRSLRDKAYMLRALRILTDGGDIASVVSAFPSLGHLFDPDTWHIHESLMARLGRIEDEQVLVDTAIAVSAFRASADCDFDELRRAWQVVTHLANAAEGGAE